MTEAVSAMLAPLSAAFAGAVGLRGWLYDRAWLPIHRLPVHEGEDGRDRLDAHLGGKLLVLVDIDLDEADSASLLIHDFLEQRPKLLAGATPRGPEVDENRRRARGFDDIGHEVLGVGFLHRGACGRGCRSITS